MYHPFPLLVPPIGFHRLIPPAVYQWIQHEARIDGGKKVTKPLCLGLLNEEFQTLLAHAETPKDKAALVKAKGPP